jgi:signal transduction histidine kinase
MKTQNLQDISDLNQLIIAIFLAVVLMSIILISFFYFSRKKIIEKELEKRDLEIAYQKELLNSVIITQEDERKRIAQDLHDDISSKLNIVSLNSQLLKADNLSQIEINEISNNIIDITKKALDNSRRIAHDLLPPVLEKFGLDAGIKELCLEISTTKSLKIDYENNINFDFSDNDKHLHVFRILQELINNSIRHGKAKNISILFYEENNLKFCKYIDDGLGFETENPKNKKGLGMKNIASRIAFLNGNLEIKSGVNEGCEFIFSF